MTVLPGTTSARQLIVDRSRLSWPKGRPACIDRSSLSVSGCAIRTPARTGIRSPAAHPDTHGVFAVATVVLVLIAALNVGGS